MCFMRSKSHLFRHSCIVRCLTPVERPVCLEIRELSAKVSATGQVILKGVNLTIREGEIHAIMGKNGCGKSTLSKVLVGHPEYEVTHGEVIYKNEDLLLMEPEERSQAGIFLSFQAPVEIPGVSNLDFLRLACNTRRKINGKPEMAPLEFYAFLTPKIKSLNIDPTFLNRNVNEGFSGGEKKRNEMLQLAVLEAEMAILDEIDSGLDIDALKDVARTVNELKQNETSILMITHYQRLLELVRPDFIHIMHCGRIVKVGGWEIIETLEAEGYASIQ